MKSTNIDGVFINVENVYKDTDVYNIEGWVYSKNEDQFIESLLINDSVLKVDWHHRSDVLEYFNVDDDSTIKTGFKISIHASLIKRNLRVKFKNNSTIQDLCSLIDFVVSKSGFAKTSKDVMVVDNFYADPDLVRDYAMNNLEYTPSDYHKGERSKSRFILEGTKEKLEEVIGKEITNWNHGGYANGVFQFCTADQPIVYHVDSQMYAGMVYLTPDAPPQTGTAMYRSKVTGISSFPGQETRGGQEYVDTFKGNNREMNFYDGTLFEKIDEVGNVYNRLVIFNSSQLHAATEYFGDAIDNARFFHMFFFDVKE